MQSIFITYKVNIQSNIKQLTAMHLKGFRLFKGFEKQQKFMIDHFPSPLLTLSHVNRDLVCHKCIFQLCKNLK